MANLEPLLARNSHFADSGSFAGVPVYPKQGICVLTCLDPRTDPADFLELSGGEAIVIRNAGGRVTPAVVEDLSYITYLSEQVFRPEGDGDDAALSAEAVTDPEQTVRHDIALLRAAPTISPKASVSGHVYDVDTGVLTTVVPTGPLPAR